VIQKLLLYARTASHLRARQVVYRPVRWAQSRLPARRLPDPEPADFGVIEAMRLVVEELGAGDEKARIKSAERIVERRFDFLNHEEHIPAIDWEKRYVSHLWTYNLHYFDYALDLVWAWKATSNERYLDVFSGLATEWIKTTSPGRGVGWEPYVVSTRLLNWTQAVVLCHGHLDAAVRDRIMSSIHQQAAFLERRLEWHILANHLQRNLCALAVASLPFSGQRSAKWLRRACDLLWAQLEEQILPDGGHFERAPMYHAIVLGDLLRTTALLRARGVSVPHIAMERMRAMIAALSRFTHADGSLHLFNDSADGIADSTGHLDHVSQRVAGSCIPPQTGAWSLSDTGYYGYADPVRGDRLIVDCGQAGPSYQPGHAHCDLLSFELDLASKRVVVDSGVSGYAGDRLREYSRSTRAHNTISIDGREQSEVWGTFRMGRQALPQECHATTGRDGAYIFQGGYRPYDSHGTLHTRSFRFLSGHLTITDRVSGANGKRIESFIHLHPDISIETIEGRLTGRIGGAAIVIEPFGVHGVEVVKGVTSPAQGWYCPQFGRALPQYVVVLSLTARDDAEFGYHIWMEGDRMNEA
jgi:uncharacterized heparinase superfamily protein